jgi:hypothetical protein
MVALLLVAVLFSVMAGAVAEWLRNIAQMIDDITDTHDRERD